MIDLSQFAEFGVLAVVIGALFAVIILGFKIFMTTIASDREKYFEVIQGLYEKNSENINLLHDENKREREKWDMESEKRELRYDRSIQQFSEAIKELRHAIDRG